MEGIEVARLRKHASILAWKAFAYGTLRYIESHSIVEQLDSECKGYHRTAHLRSSSVKRIRRDGVVTISISCSTDTRHRRVDESSGED